MADVKASDVLGLIPAHAGKTTAASTCARSRPAHPRSRGENPKADARTVNELGSSPLTRGKRTRQLRFSCSAGLIPAHAGKTR